MGQFKPGESGNKAGRPRGAKDRRTELRALLQPHAKKLIKKAVDLALSGDTAALKLCIDRICSPLKPQAEPIAAAIPTSGTLAEQGAAVFQAAATGTIGTDEAAALMTILSGQARILEISELQERLSQIEKQLAGGKQ